MHPDYLPFVALALACSVAAILLLKESRWGAASFLFGGLVPSLAVLSNSVPSSIPFELEMMGILCAFPIITGTFVTVVVRRMMRRWSAISFCIASSVSVCLSAYVVIFFLGAYLIPI